MKHTFLVLVLAAATATAATAATAPTTSVKDTQVFECGKGRYSDMPVGLKMGQCNTVNVRTGTVTPPTPAANSGDASMSLADRQAALNADIAAENKRREEEAAKMAAETKAENCKAAQMNREMVDKTNARNKADLIPKFDADIAKYCN